MKDNENFNNQNPESAATESDALVVNEASNDEPSKAVTDSSSDAVTQPPEEEAKLATEPVAETVEPAEVATPVNEAVEPAEVATPASEAVEPVEAVVPVAETTEQAETVERAAKPPKRAKKDREREAEPVSNFDDQPSSGGNKPRRTIRPLTAIISVAMVVLLFTGILVTMLLIDVINRPEGDPIATIYLSNGDQLEFVIFEENAPIAASNFMFLAKNKFFDGTLFHDNQNDWLRFMGMEDYDTYRGSSDDYCKTFSGFDLYDYDWAKRENTNIFNYRLRTDVNAINFSKYANNEGLLVFMYNNSSTLFQISCIDNPNLAINNNIRSTFTVFGQYANDSTLQTLRKLNLGSDYKNHSTKNGAWYNPNTELVIREVKISNYDKKKWDGKKGIMNNFNTHIASLGGYNTHLSNYINAIS